MQRNEWESNGLKTDLQILPSSQNGFCPIRNFSLKYFFSLKHFYSSPFIQRYGAIWRKIGIYFWAKNAAERCKVKYIDWSLINVRRFEIKFLNQQKTFTSKPNRFKLPAKLDQITTILFPHFSILSFSNPNTIRKKFIWKPLIHFSFYWITFKTFLSFFCNGLYSYHAETREKRNLFAEFTLNCYWFWGNDCFNAAALIQFYVVLQSCFNGSNQSPQH